MSYHRTIVLSINRALLDLDSNPRTVVKLRQASQYLSVRHAEMTCTLRCALNDLAATQTSLATLKRIMEESGQAALSDVWNTMLDLRDRLIESILSHELMLVGNGADAFARAVESGTRRDT